MTSLSIAVVGAGISGLSAAWLLSKAHRVTLFEANAYAGGHSNTISVESGRGVCPVDTGFIVYNPPNYPNLCALFDRLNVPTKLAPMTFAASLDDGAYEYSGTRLGGLFGQPSNLLDPGHWRMLRDVLRFFRNAPQAAERMPEDYTLGAYLRDEGYSETFIARHLVPMASAIWSAPVDAMMDYPVKAFVRFFGNHGLLQVSNRPSWRTVDGGSRAYVERLVEDGAFTLRRETVVSSVKRLAGRVIVTDDEGVAAPFDHVVLACHADQALALLGDPDSSEEELLGAFAYTYNDAVVHSDPSLMPVRRRLWSSWNYIERSNGDAGALTVSYWMNALQSLDLAKDIFVTLNPPAPPASGTEIARFSYQHPLFTSAALRAQKHLWSLQGQRNIWFCGSYFGAGFHEDGLQSGLAVAEDLGGVLRPWSVAAPSGRIHRASLRPQFLEAAE